MLITKFNKMIRNRIVWWIIGSIVIITFVGWFSPRGSCERMPKESHLGSLNGEPVDDAEYREARAHQYLTYCLMARRPLNNTPQLVKYLDEQAWKRIAALRTARQLGLASTGEEVLKAIVSSSEFQENGAFNRNLYDALVHSLNTTKDRFEQVLAENILLQKLQYVCGSAAWVSPLEMQTMVARYSDLFQVQYAVVTTNRIPPVQLTDADRRAYFDAHTNQFVIPDQVSVRYAALPVSNRLDGMKIDRDAIEQYYDDHAADYMTAGTNGEKTAIPLDTVSATISNLLLHEEARQKTRDAAIDFVTALTPGRDGSAPTFEALAASNSFAVHTTGLFDASTVPAEIEAKRAFAQSAFRLRATPEDYFSDPVTGSNFVYVMALASNAEARLPEFDEVRDKVTPLAEEKAAADKLAEMAKALRDRIQSKLGARSFEDLAREQSLNVSTAAEFSVYTAPEGLNTPEILDAIASRNSGELSDVAPGTNGLLIAYIVKRAPAAKDEADVVRSQVVAGLTRKRARTLFGEWEDSMIRTGRQLSTNVQSRAPVDLPLVD